MADHIIIGGGAIGLSLAYHLARDGQTGVLLLERNRLTSGTSWHAAGIVGPLRATMHMTRLAMRALELFPALEQETGLSTGYRRTGGCWLAREPARMDELQRIAAIGRVAGLTPEIITPGEVKIPGLNTDGLIGALRVDEDASVNPVDLCMAYAKAARARGAVIRENTPVARVIVQDRQAVGVALTDGTELSANTVSICTGAWSRALTEPLGVTLPLQPVEHMYVVTEPIPGLPDPFPVLRDLDQGIYVKGDAGKLVIGGFERDAKPWDAFGPEGDRPFLELPEDWTQFTPFMEAALALIPTLEHTGIQHFMNGPESFTNDTRPLIGETPEVAGLFVAAGMNSVGVMSSAGIGRLLADWIVAGAAPHDVWEVDIRRADPLTSGSVHMKSRMKEAVSDAFALHWPYKQPKAGRNLRRSALHDQWAADGAVFGLTAGWERALWYAHDTAERDLPYCVGAQPWQPIADREAQAMAAGGALLDLSPFTKIEVTGPQALPLLQHLCTSNINTKTGAVTYTQMLNPRGGIEADVTITRHAADSFRITSGAATRWKDLAWIRRHASEYTIEINDKTETEAVIGVMGPQSRAVLSSLSDTDWKIFPLRLGPPRHYCRPIHHRHPRQFCRRTRLGTCHPRHRSHHPLRSPAQCRCHTNGTLCARRLPDRKGLQTLGPRFGAGHFAA